jgi:hypothetical protein
MEASKVTISPATLDMIRFSSGAKKVKLREEAVKNLIRSKPAGTVIRLRSLQNVTMLASASATLALVKRLMRRGEVTRYNPNPLKTASFAYTVADTPESGTGSRGFEVFNPRQDVPPIQAAPIIDNKGFNQHAVTRLAQEYAWDNPEATPILKAFLKYMESK